MKRPCLVVLALVGCARAEPPVGPVDPPAPPEALEIPIVRVPVTMRGVQFARGGMELELLDAPVDTHAWPVGGVLSQVVLLSGDDVLRIHVRAGEGETLESMRRDHVRTGTKASVVRRGKICGGRSKRIELSEPEEFIECIEYADGSPSSPGYIPATTVVAVHFRSGNLDVVATWDVPTARREEFRRAEKRFFASFRCLENDA